MPERAWLECNACSARFPIEARFYGCPDCAGNGRTAPLEMTYNLGTIDPKLASDGASGLWRWSSLLPPIRERSKISLGEGGTPLIPIDCGTAALTSLLKNETANPTWSWKDRPNCISIAMAREFDFRGTAAISTGNH